MPVEDDRERPLFSVKITSYNRPQLLTQTIESVLGQDIAHHKIDIEVIDDCSSSFDFLRFMTNYASRGVKLYQPPQRCGASAIYTTCVQRARGIWIHILNDDDLVLPTFYNEYESFAERFPECVLIAGPVISINENGEPRKTIFNNSQHGRWGIVDRHCERLAVGNFVPFPSVVVRRAAYEAVGGFAPKMRFCFDWEMWVRIAQLGPIGLMHEAKAYYRAHSGRATVAEAITGNSLRESLATIKLALALLPRHERLRIRETAFAELAKNVFGWTQLCVVARRYDTALWYTVWRLLYDPDVRSIAGFAKLVRAMISEQNRLAHKYADPGR